MLMVTEVYAARNDGVIVPSGSMILSINSHGHARRGFKLQASASWQLLVCETTSSKMTVHEVCSLRAYQVRSGEQPDTLGKWGSARRASDSTPRGLRRRAERALQIAAERRESLLLWVRPIFTFSGTINWLGRPNVKTAVEVARPRTIRRPSQTMHEQTIASLGVMP